MTQPSRFTSRYVAFPVVLAGTMALAGCLGPTYGTDQTAGEQLLSDLGSSMSLGRRNNEVIQYAPRPGLVEPANPSILPPPQERVTEQEGVWPETPEARRARIRAEIDEGNQDPRFVGGSEAVAAVGASEGPARTASGRRVFLTDPPSDYVQPVATADVNDLGTSERIKERQRERATGDPTGLRRLIPWL